MQLCHLNAYMHSSSEVTNLLSPSRLQDLTEMQQAFGKDWKKAGTELSHKKVSLLA